MTSDELTTFAALCREYALAEAECERCEAASTVACQRKIAARAAIDRFVDRGISLARTVGRALGNGDRS